MWSRGSDPSARGTNAERGPPHVSHLRCGRPHAHRSELLARGGGPADAAWGGAGAARPPRRLASVEMAGREPLRAPGLAHMASEALMVVRDATNTHRFLRARLAILRLVTIIVDVGETAAMFVLERDAPGSGFDDVGARCLGVHAADRSARECRFL